LKKGFLFITTIKMAIDKRIFDKAEFLDRIGHDTAFMYEILNAFFEEITEKLDNLKKAFEESDKESVRILSHGIKGASLTVSFKQIGKIAEFIEKNILNNENDCSNKIQELENEFNKLNDLYKTNSL